MLAHQWMGIERLRQPRPPRQPEPHRQRPRVHGGSPRHRRVLAVLHEDRAGPLHLGEHPVHHARGRDRIPIVGERDGPGLGAELDLRGLLAAAALHFQDVLGFQFAISWPRGLQYDAIQDAHPDVSRFLTSSVEDSILIMQDERIERVQVALLGRGN